LCYTSEFHLNFSLPYHVRVFAVKIFSTITKNCIRTTAELRTNAPKQGTQTTLVELLKTRNREENGKLQKPGLPTNVT